ncbi:MAG: hypothetical protein ACI837_002142 [Crocinitomicaceae bacterium]|jgi:hypothetical protein
MFVSTKKVYLFLLFINSLLLSFAQGAEMNQFYTSQFTSAELHSMASVHFKRLFKTLKEKYKGDNSTIDEEKFMHLSAVIKQENAEK